MLSSCIHSILRILIHIFETIDILSNENISGDYGHMSQNY